MATLDDELLLIAGKGRNKRGKRGRSDSEDDEDWDDDDEYQDSEEEKKPAKKRSAAAKAKAAKQELGDEDEDDDDENSDDEAKLAAMTELERELYLFERDERRAREREKQQAQQQARKAKEKSVEVRASSRRARPATGADTAIGKLAAARQQREKRAARRKEEEDEEEEEEEKEEEEEEEEEEEGAAEPSTSEREEEAAEDVAAARRFGARGARGYDEGEGVEGEEEEEDEPALLASVLQMQLKRDMLEQWHNQPFFDEVVRGCVVRIVYGTFIDAAGQKQPNYLMMRVVEATDRQPYRRVRFTQQPGARTSKHLVLEDGGHSKAMQMAQISSKEITQEEFDRWNRHCERGQARKITRRDAATAAAQIQRALNYKFTKEDIQRKLAARREKGEVVGGLVTEKARLRGLLEAAQSAGDTEAAAELRAKLDELEANQTAQRRAAAEAKGGMASINARNRTANFEKALRNVGSRPEGDAGRGDGGTDVFSRRQTQSKVYWQTGKKADAKEQPAGGTPEPERRQQQQAEAAAAGPDGPAAAATHKLSRTLSKMEPSELLGLLDIGVDLTLLPGGGDGGPGAAVAATARRMLGGSNRWPLSDAGRALAVGAPAVGPRAEVTLSEWFRRMQSTAH